MNKNILLIGGKAGSGKDTIADYLVKFHGYKRYAFADSLKDYTSKTFNIERSLFDNQDTKMSKISVNGVVTSPRKMLIDVSLEKKKNNPNIWITTVIKLINETDTDKIVISDFRYPQEFYELFKYKNFKIETLLITRKNVSLIDDPSEKSLNNFDFDYFILNDSSLDKFYENIEKIIMGKSVVTTL